MNAQEENELAQLRKLKAELLRLFESAHERVNAPITGLDAVQMAAAYAERSGRANAVIEMALEELRK